jgi:hypothetical protein
MKIWLAFFLVICFTFAPMLSAAADTPTPTPSPTTTPIPPTTTPGPTQTPTPTPTPLPAMSVHVSAPDYPPFGSITGSIQCDTIEGQHYTIPAGGGQIFSSRDFICLGDIIFNSLGSPDDYAQVTATVTVTDTATIYYNADVQAVQGYFGNGSGADPSQQGTVGTGQTIGSVVHGGEVFTRDAVAEMYIFVHDSTNALCGQDLTKTSTVDSGSIPATSETGVTETLHAGDEYMLTVWGGPWNDGTDDQRFDTAIKLNTEDWTTLSDYAMNWLGPVCTGEDPTDQSKTILVFNAPLHPNIDDPSVTTMPWAIRVNDLAGQFGDNVGSMNFELDEMSPLNPPGCQDQFLQGTSLYSGTIDAKASAGSYIHWDPFSSTHTNLPTGGWVEIVTSGGPWQDGGTPPDRYDIAIQNPDASWSELSGSANASCSTTNGNYITAYYQLPTSNGIYLRVNDTGGNFSDNTGSMNYQVYSVTYSPNPASGCAENFQIGTQIKTVTANANVQAGVSVGNLGNGGFDVTGGGEADLRYYAIETSGVYYDGITPETGGGIASSNDATSAPAGGDWNYLQDAPGVVCAVPLDPIGHIRIYLPLSLIKTYWVRAQALGISQNWPAYSGSLTFTISKATNLQAPGYTPSPTMPGATVCDSYYTKGAAGETYVINGNNAGGLTLPTLTSGHVYAVETTLGPWSNGGVSSYAVAVNEGLGWTNLAAWGSSVCAESGDGNHILMYFQAEAGRVYKFRADDPGGVFTDNTGSISLTIYNNVVVGIAPWSTCADNYTLSPIAVPDNVIPTGVVMPSVTIADVVPGNSYAIEISQDSWWYAVFQQSIHLYSSEISKDNGSSWTAFGPDLAGAWGATCVIQTNQAIDDTINTATKNDLKTYRVYFKAGNNPYLMRIPAMQVMPDDFGGNLHYILYLTVPTVTQNPTPPGGINPVSPPAWILECTETILRPNGFFKDTPVSLPLSLGTFNLPLPNVDDWIAYLENSIRSYFAWCPQDTAALSAIPATLNGYEPFGTISDTIGIMQTLQSNVIALQASGGEGENFAPPSIFNQGGGESDANSIPDILPVLGSDSPWNGGKLKWTPVSLFSGNGGAGGGESTSYYYDCLGIMQPHVGLNTAVGECAALSFVKTDPLFWTLLQFVFDVGTLFTLYRFVRAGWIDAGASG